MRTRHGWATYYSPGPELDGAGLVCLGTGWQSGAIARVRRRTLDHDALVLIDDGVGVVRYDEVERPVRAGDLLWLRPGTCHGYGPDSEGWTERWVLMRGPAAALYERSQVGAREEAGSRVISLSGVVSDVVRRCFAQLAASRDALSYGDHLQRSALLHELIAAATRRTGGAMTGILEALAAEPDGPRTVAQHARTLQLSEDSLRNRVHRATGLTTKAFLLRARVDRAKALLAETDLTVTQVAARVGYDDPAYFARLFRLVTGDPPTAFRARHLRGN